MAPFAQKRLLAHLNPAKNPEGRPSLYREEYCERVIQEMAQGVSLTGFAGKIGVSKDAIYDWIREHSEFSHAVSRAKAARVLWWEEKLMRARYGAQASASIFALRNADPSEWRDVRNVQHDHSHTIANLTDEQLLAIASGRASDVTVIEHDDQVLPSERDTK
jgi:hypothetical protein